LEPPWRHLATASGAGRGLVVAGQFGHLQGPFGSRARIVALRAGRTGYQGMVRVVVREQKHSH
jgi:hypothetical protein